MASAVQLHQLASGASTQVSVTSYFYAHVQKLFGVMGSGDCSECVHTAIFVFGWNDSLVKINFADAACNRSDAAWHLNAHVSLRLTDDIVVFLFVRTHLIEVYMSMYMSVADVNVTKYDTDRTSVNGIGHTCMHMYEYIIFASLRSIFQCMSFV